jgi:hypothetical protein
MSLDNAFDGSLLIGIVLVLCNFSKSLCLIQILHKICYDSVTFIQDICLSGQAEKCV